MPFGGQAKGSNAPKETEAAFRSGWYHTGDLGRQDDQGHYFFVDRKKDVIRYKGRNVSSVAVENVAHQHPGVVDVAVFGVPSDELAAEHEIMLAAVRKPGTKLAEEDLARFHQPKCALLFRAPLHRVAGCPAHDANTKGAQGRIAPPGRGKPGLGCRGRKLQTSTLAEPG